MTTKKKILLTTAEVARITGRCPGYVPDWARRHGISTIQTERGHLLYPAAAVREAHRTATAIPAPLRLRRFVARALIT